MEAAAIFGSAADSLFREPADQMRVYFLSSDVGSGKREIKLRPDGCEGRRSGKQSTGSREQLNVISTGRGDNSAIDLNYS